ncbi:hypothetical protein BCF59_0040 [Mycoplasmopsis mustelae]|uniref:Lipoprotein n=1 Tax=Mycoplasmopsis mustelae TaxID=171289 RepID=A0A4R7UDH6_9BACT|nr:hypothetical protein [Mycoplasmopsis mustelae]TDV24096.1 hypothetical protein BCF59_0040 [Mycoplasmopsis mustelae]
MKNKYWLLLSGTFTFPVFVVACTNINNEKKVAKEYDEEKYAENFLDLLDKYQEDNEIKRLSDNYFESIFLSYNSSIYTKKTKKKTFLDRVNKDYILLKSSQELQEKIIDKINLDFFKNINSKTINENNVEVDTYKEEKLMSESQLKEFIKQKFSKIFLNNESIDTFFITKNLFIFQKINIRPFLNSSEIVPTKKINIFNLVSPSSILKYDLAYQPVEYPLSFTLLYKVFDKSVNTVIVNEELNKSQAIKLYDYLKAKYRFDK